MDERGIGRIRNIEAKLINTFISFFIYKAYKTLYGGDFIDEDLKQEFIDLIKEFNFKDSIDIGNSKTGSVKVYVDFSNKTEAETKIQNAIDILKKKRKQILK